MQMIVLIWLHLFHPAYNGVSLGPSIQHFHSNKLSPTSSVKIPSTGSSLISAQADVDLHVRNCQTVSVIFFRTFEGLLQSCSSSCFGHICKKKKTGSGGCSTRNPKSCFEIVPPCPDAPQFLRLPLFEIAHLLEDRRHGMWKHWSLIEHFAIQSAAPLAGSPVQ